MRVLFANLAFTLRLMRRAPGFYALVLLLLSAGIGATVAVFSVAQKVLLDPLPYEDPSALTELVRRYRAGDSNVSAANFIDWRAQGTSFEQMAATEVARYSLSRLGAPAVSVRVAAVTADFFPVFRLRPLLGRLLDANDDRPGAPLVTVISARLWDEHFAADPEVIGRTVLLNGRASTVVGVGPRGFTFAASDEVVVEAWIPYFGSRSPAEVAKQLREARGLDTLTVVGRRARGVSLAQAQTQMTLVAANLAVAYPENALTGIYLRDLHTALAGALGRQMRILFAAVALVFAVITANVSSLILARSQARRGELATRAALGASWATLALQVVTETFVLFGLGSILGCAAASLLVDRLATSLVAGTGMEGAVVRLDQRAIVAAVVLSFLFGLAASLAPALVTARVEPASVLKQSSTRAGVTRSQSIARGVLVVAQLAVAFALLTGSAIAVAAFARIARTPPGFEPSDLATAAVNLPLRKYDRDGVRNFLDAALAKAAALPGVDSATAASSLPMTYSSQSLTFTIEGRPPWPPGEAPPLGLNFVGPEYFKTMRIPLLRGRAITAEDTKSSRPVMVLSKQAADRFFPGEDPIGKRLDWGEPDDSGSAVAFVWREVVGVVGDVRKNGLMDEPGVEGYTPFAQTPESTTPDATRLYLAIRTKTPGAVLATLPALIQAIDPELAPSKLVTMDDRIAHTIGVLRKTALVLTGFAVAALLLATLGLFGLVSYATAERTRELGIRLALGSPAGAVVHLVVRGAMRLVAVGLGVGLLLSLWVAREVAAVMPGATLDPAVVAPIPILLGAAALVASLLPALRAVRTPPASALRYD